MSLTFAQARKTSGEKASKQKLLIDYGSFIQIALLFQRKESESNTHGSSLASIVKVLQHMIPHLHRCAQLSCHREIQLLVKEGKVEQVSDGRYRLHPKSLKELTSCNPYYHFFQQQKAQEPEDMARLFDPALDDERRLELFNLTDVSIAEEYSWAIPNDQALKIIQHYGPVIEIGAGKGYWARLLVEHMDVDILCFDSIIEEQSKLWYPVQLGTPKILSMFPERTLMLCYPDDFEQSEESMALACLNNYVGEYVIHIGELLGGTMCLPDPWGRTSAPEFQVRLATSFHKILQIPLPSWHSSIDTLSVWKRTQTCFLPDSGDIYAYLPPSESIEASQVQFCPATAHLIGSLG